MHNILQREWDAFFHRQGHHHALEPRGVSPFRQTRPDGRCDTILADGKSLWWDLRVCVRTLPASAATEAAFPGLAIDRVEAEKTRKHASLITQHRPGDQFVPVVMDEHGALGPAGRALARRVCARAAGPAPALAYGLRRLAVVAARRVHAIMHTTVLRVPPAEGPVEPADPHGSHPTDDGADRLGDDPPHDSHPEMSRCEDDLTRAPDDAADGAAHPHVAGGDDRAPAGDGDGTAHSPMVIDSDEGTTDGNHGDEGGVDNDAATGVHDDGEDAARTAIGGEGVGVGVGAGFSVPVAAAAAGAGAAAVFPDAHEA